MDKDLRALERAAASDPHNKHARHALLAARARLGDPMSLARIRAIQKLTLGTDAEESAIDYETSREINSMIADLWRRVPLKNQIKIANAIINQEFRRAGFDPVQHSDIWPSADIFDGKVSIADDFGHIEYWGKNTTPASWRENARELARSRVGDLAQWARDEEQQNRIEQNELDRISREEDLLF